jgi:hypothetical protein
MASRCCGCCGTDLHDSVGPHTSCLACRRPTSCWLVVDDEGRVAAAADEREALFADAFEAELRDNRSGLFVATS